MGCTPDMTAALEAAFGANSMSMVSTMCDSFVNVPTDIEFDGFGGVDYTAGTMTDISVGLDTLYTLICSAMVFLMHGGFAMLCAGAIRSKNTMNILLATVLDAAVSAIMFYLVGFAFAYGTGANPNPFIGDNLFALSEFKYTYGAASWQKWLFQWAFAATAATIPAGCVAERFNFNAYLAYTVVLSGFVYPVVVHWVWAGNGWLGAWNADKPLFDVGMIDFAGSAVVHMVGGFTGIIGCILVGPRMGRFDSNGKPVDMPGHSATLVVLGTILLWFGWYGFNPGSVLHITNVGFAEIVGRSAVTTTLSGSACALTCLVTSMVRMRSWDLIAVCNGLLSGLVAVTAGAHVMEPWAAIVLGITASWFFDFICWLWLKLRIDDPLAAGPMHGFAGLWGVFYVGLLAKQEYVYESYGSTSPAPVTADNLEGIMAKPYGAFYPGGGGKLLACQIVGILVIAGWVVAIMGTLFFALKFFNLLRISPEEEQAGLDMSKHGGSAYNYAHGLNKPDRAPITNP